MKLRICIPSKSPAMTRRDCARYSVVTEPLLQAEKHHMLRGTRLDQRLWSLTDAQVRSVPYLHAFVLQQVT